MSHKEPRHSGTLARDGNSATKPEVETGTRIVWQAESLIFVLAGPFGVLDAYSIYSDLVGAAPRNLAPIHGQPGSTATGLFDGHQLQILTRSGRLELNLSVPPSPDERGLIKDPLNALKTLEGLVGSLTERYSVNRLSFVTTLARVAANAEEAAEWFYTTLDIPRIDGAQPLDLALQYNKVSETSTGKRMNGLSRWSVVNVQIATIAVAPTPITQTESNYDALDLLLDVNIPLQSTPIFAEESRTLVKELADYTRTLISEVS